MSLFTRHTQNMYTHIHIHTQCIQTQQFENGKTTMNFVDCIQISWIDSVLKYKTCQREDLIEIKEVDMNERKRVTQECVKKIKNNSCLSLITWPHPRASFNLPHATKRAGQRIHRAAKKTSVELCRQIHCENANPSSDWMTAQWPKKSVLRKREKCGMRECIQPAPITPQFHSISRSV